MHKPGRREVEHDIRVDAPAATVYRLLAEVENWPRIFPPTVHVHQLERTGNEQRIEVWATANGEAKTWTSLRILDPERLQIRFSQEVSPPPIAAMSGVWLMEPVADGGTLVRLLHDYRAVGDDPDGLAWIDRAVDSNSRSELESLKINVEAAAGSKGELSMSFEDTVRIAGAVEDVYDFINNAQLWPERLPHVARVWLDEVTPGLQILEMDTLTLDGSKLTTRSVRVCFPPRRIVYKQIRLPSLLTMHTGSWQFEDDGEGGVAATARHTVMLGARNITAVLGVGAGIGQARDYVRGALSVNTMATLGYAKVYAERRREIGAARWP
jgi:aromatase